MDGYTFRATRTHCACVCVGGSKLSAALDVLRNSSKLASNIRRRNCTFCVYSVSRGMGNLFLKLAAWKVWTSGQMTAEMRKLKPIRCWRTHTKSAISPEIIHTLLTGEFDLQRTSFLPAFDLLQADFAFPQTCMKRQYQHDTQKNPNMTHKKL